MNVPINVQKSFGQILNIQIIINKYILLFRIFKY